MSLPFLGDQTLPFLKRNITPLPQGLWSANTSSWLASRVTCCLYRIRARFRPSEDQASAGGVKTKLGSRRQLSRSHCAPGFSAQRRQARGSVLNNRSPCCLGKADFHSGPWTPSCSQGNPGWQLCTTPCHMQVPRRLPLACFCVF